MSQKVRKGVIAVAGHGTRFLPATKSMPKEMLPIIDTPIVQYIVEEMVEAGIEQIIFVTSSDKRALEDHFDHSLELEHHLEEQGKLDRLEKIAKLPNMASFVYIRQKGPYGNGTPCLNVKDIIGNEPFIYAFGDDLVKSKVSFTKQLIETYEKTGASCVLGAQEVPMEEIHKYGCYALKDGTSDMEISRIVEKPKREEAPSNLAGFGRYLLDPAIFGVLESLKLGKDNELWLMDGVDELMRSGHKVVAQSVQDGQWITTGDPLNFLKATVEYLKDRDDLRDQFKQYLYDSQFLSGNDSSFLHGRISSEINFSV
ncbi:MAG: UTP--glucose-1-phosphate uridylyltransferase [Candidatus Gracilibacteria bacterium]